jgi:hypothetical protein
MARNFTHAWSHLGTGNHTVNNNTSARQLQEGRLSDGTMIIASHQGTSNDIQFAYSADDGDTWTMCATEMVGTFTGTGGVSLKVCSDDTLWVIAHDASNYPYFGTFTFSGTDVVAGKAVTDIKIGAYAHYACEMTPFVDPDDSSKYRAIFSGYENSAGKHFFRDVTMDGDWTNFSDNGAIFTPSAGVTWSSSVEVVAKWTERQNKPSGANPEFLCAYSKATTLYFQKATYTAGAPGSWGTGSEYTLGSANQSSNYNGVQGFYDPDETTWAFVFGNTGTIYSYYTDGASNASAIGITASFAGDNDGCYLWYDKDGILYRGWWDLSADLFKVWSADKSSGYGSATWTAGVMVMPNFSCTYAKTTDPYSPVSTYSPQLFREFIDGDGHYALDLYFFTSQADNCINHVRLDGSWLTNGTRVMPSIRAVSKAQGLASAHPLNVTKPSGTAEGDLLIAFWHASDYPTMNTDSYNIEGGDWLWLEIGDHSPAATWTSGYYGASRIFYKVAGASEPADYDFDHTGSFSSATANSVHLVAVNPGTGFFHPRWPTNGGSYESFVTSNTTTHNIYGIGMAAVGLQIASIASHDTGDDSPWTPVAGSPSWTEHSEWAYGTIAYREMGTAATRYDTENQAFVSTNNAETTQMYVSVLAWEAAPGAGGGIGWGIAL